MANAESSRCETGEQIGIEKAKSGLTYHRWPMPPGPEQFDWEKPRVDGKFLNPAWVEQLMGYPEGWASKLGGRRHQLESLGNAVVPQVVACIGKAIERLDNLLEQA